MKLPVVILNFTHVYEEEKFFRNKRFSWVDCTKLEGTDCFCDPESEKILRTKISVFPPEGIHFIDSGNYHYLTKFWTDRIKYPFSLIVFDHHPDMQDSSFSGFMSCGCWVKEAIDTNPYLCKVCIIGASESLARRVDSRYFDKLLFYGEHDFDYAKNRQLFYETNLCLPVYISIDKDVLGKEAAATNWDQGSMTLMELERMLDYILKTRRPIGIDICGECSETLDLFEKEKSEQINNNANEELAELIFDA